MAFWNRWFGKREKRLTESDDLDEDDLAEIRAAAMWRQRAGKRRLTEAIFEIDNPDAGTEFDDRFFVSLERAAALDLPPQIQRKAQRLSILLWRKNVRAYAATELLKDFVLGEGIRFKAKDDKVQAVLEEHWEVNEWEDKIEERMRALGIFGEQIYPAFVNTDTGLVRITSVLPLRIRHVNRDPNDAEELISVATSVGAEQTASVIYLPGFIGDPDAGKVFQIIRPGENGQLIFEPRLNNAFFFAINRIAGATRGAPDMLSAVDWLEGIDGFVFSLMERASITQNVVWDLQFDGLTANEIKERVKAFINALRSGGVFGHNERVKLNIQVPQLASSDAQGAVDIIEAQINAGTRFPGLMFGKSKDLTRAAAAELSIPVEKMISGRQKFVRRMLTKIFRFQIQESRKVGALDGVEDFSFVIEMPQVFLRDAKTIAQALVALSTALVTAQENAWISDDEAGSIFKMALREIGSSGRSGHMMTGSDFEDQSGHRVDDNREEPMPMQYARALDKVTQDGNSRNDQGAGDAPGAGV